MLNNKNTKYGMLKSIFSFIANVVSWAAFSLLIIIAGCLVYYIVSVQLYASKGETYEPPIALYTIVSPSMEPTIKVYDVIVNSKVKSVDDLDVGDVVTFISTSSISAGMTVTHRIDEVVETDSGKKFRTKGDNNLTADSGLIDENDILGKVVLKIPQLGRVHFLLASKSGWLIAIVIPALCIIIYDILKIFKLVGVKQKVDKINEVEDDDQKRKNEENRKLELKKKLNQVNDEELPVVMDENTLLPDNILDDLPKESTQLLDDYDPETINLPDLAKDEDIELPDENNNVTEDNDDFDQTDSFELPKLKA